MHRATLSIPTKAPLRCIVSLSEGVEARESASIANVRAASHNTSRHWPLLYRAFRAILASLPGAVKAALTLYAGECRPFPDITQAYRRAGRKNPPTCSSGIRALLGRGEGTDGRRPLRYWPRLSLFAHPGSGRMFSIGEHNTLKLRRGWYDERAVIGPAINSPHHVTRP